MAGGARPDPFRTRKLSRRAPMVLRGKPVGEQGAADRWTALPYRCGAGPPGAPLLFCLPGAAAPGRPHSSGRGTCGALGPGPPAWAGGPFPSFGSAAPVLAGLGPSGRMRLAGAGAPAAPAPFRAPWGAPAGEPAAKPVKCPRRGAAPSARRRPRIAAGGGARALEEFPCWPMPVADCERRRAPYDEGIRLAFDPVVLICRSGERVFSWCIAWS